MSARSPPSPSKPPSPRLLSQLRCFLSLWGVFVLWILWIGLSFLDETNFDGGQGSYFIGSNLLVQRSHPDSLVLLSSIVSYLDRVFSGRWCCFRCSCPLFFFWSSQLFFSSVKFISMRLPLFSCRHTWCLHPTSLSSFRVIVKV
jgi:hypothetical protein